MARRAWQDFERRTLRMLSKNLLADRAEGRSKCFLAGYQIDAYGVWGKVALVFECKTTTRRKRINVNSEVDKLAGKRSAVVRHLRRLYGNAPPTKLHRPRTFSDVRSFRDRRLLFAHTRPAWQVIPLLERKYGGSAKIKSTQASGIFARISRQSPWKILM
jgi:hypothetical protein